jgi:hypothetical protein
MTDLPIAVRPWYRKMRFLLPIGTFVVALGLHLFLSHYEEQRWQKLLKDIKADGEELDFFALFPAVPDEQNFGAIDLLDGIADAEFQKTPEWQQRVTLLNQLCFDTAKVDSSLPLEIPSGSYLTSRRKWQAQEWAAFHREQKFFPMPPPSGDDAKDLLTAMSAAEPLMKQMVQALDRPFTQLTPSWSEREIEGPVVAYPSEHTSLVMHIPRFLGMHSEAALAAGRVQAATDDVRVMLRFSELAHSDGRLIDGLIGVTNLLSALNNIWSLLQSHKCDTAQLKQIAEALRRIDPSAMLLHCKRGEQGAAMEWQKWSEGHPKEALEMARETQSTHRNVHSLLGKSLYYCADHFAPNWYYQSQTTDSFRRILVYSIRPLRGQGLAACLMSEEQEIAETKKRSWAHRFRMFDSDQSFRSFATITAHFATASIRRDQALIACALEQYHLQHQAYPDHLTQLVPSLLPSVPTDLYDGNPMRYAPSKTGRYRVWSIGPDGIDNGGTETDPDPRPLTTSKDLGDLIWSYEPPLEAED